MRQKGRREKILVIALPGIGDEPLRFDVLVEDCLLLELKCVQEILPVHKAQLLSYMKLMDIPIGLILNFHEMKLTDGVVRIPVRVKEIVTLAGRCC